LAIHGPRIGFGLTTLALAVLASAGTGVLVSEGARQLEPSAPSVLPADPEPTPVTPLVVRRAPGARIQTADAAAPHGLQGAVVTTVVPPEAPAAVPGAGVNQPPADTAVEPGVLPALPEVEVPVLTPSSEDIPVLHGLGKGAGKSADKSAGKGSGKSTDRRTTTHGGKKSGDRKTTAQPDRAERSADKGSGKSR
jgi:hypothetical protein